MRRVWWGATRVWAARCGAEAPRSRGAGARCWPARLERLTLLRHSRERRAPPACSAMWILAFLSAILISFWLVRYYAERKTHWGIMFIVAFSWALGFSYFLVLPFDIAGAMCRSCRMGDALATSPGGVSDAISECNCYPLNDVPLNLGVLADIIPVIYILTTLCGYLMNDFLRSYIDSGEFNTRGKLKDALMDALIFYVPAAIVGVIFLVWMIVHADLTFEMVRALIRGLINAIGLFLLIAFLGYGFVEVPRHLLNKANTDGQLRYAKFRVAVHSEALQNARRKLEETLELVHSTDQQLRAEGHSVLHEHMAAILRKVPRPEGAAGAHGTQPMRSAPKDPGGPGGTISAPTTPPDAESGGGARSLADSAGGASTSSGRKSLFGRSGGGAKVADEKLLPTTRKGLVALNLRLMLATKNEKRQRSMYEQEVHKALRLQALFEPPSTATSTTHGLGGDSAAGKQSRWQSTIKPCLYRISAVLCGTLSVIIIWCEGTILFDDPPFNLNLSPLSYLFRALGHSGGYATARLDPPTSWLVPSMPP